MGWRSVISSDPRNDCHTGENNDNHLREATCRDFHSIIYCRNRILFRKQHQGCCFVFVSVLTITNMWCSLICFVRHNTPARAYRSNYTAAGWFKPPWPLTTSAHARTCPIINVVALPHILRLLPSLSYFLIAFVFYIYRHPEDTLWQLRVFSPVTEPHELTIWFSHVVWRPLATYSRAAWLRPTRYLGLVACWRWQVDSLPCMVLKLTCDLRDQSTTFSKRIPYK